MAGMLNSKSAIPKPKLSGALFTGPPGTGKTLLAEKLAEAAGVPFRTFFFGFTQKHLDEAEKLIGTTGMVALVFDDIHLSCPARETGPMLAGVRRLMQLAWRTGGAQVIATAPSATHIHQSLLSSTRLYRVVEFPNTEGKAAIIELHTKDVAKAKDVDDTLIAKALHGFSPSDVATVCKAAIREARMFHRDALCRDDFHAALAQVKPSLKAQ